MTRPNRKRPQARGTNLRSADIATLARTQRVERMAEARRQALLVLLDQEGLTLADLARRAGFVSGNRLYNYMGGRSASLSENTWVDIKLALPNVDLNHLLLPWLATPDQPSPSDDRTDDPAQRTIPSVPAPSASMTDVAPIQRQLEHLEQELARLKRQLAGTGWRPIEDSDP